LPQNRARGVMVLGTAGGVLGTAGAVIPRLERFQAVNRNDGDQPPSGEFLGYWWKARLTIFLVIWLLR
jgi:hypothetical protein